MARLTIPVVCTGVAVSFAGTTLVRSFGIAIAAGATFAAATAISTAVFAALPVDVTSAVEFANFQASANVGQALGAIAVGALADFRSSRFAGTVAVAALAGLMTVLERPTSTPKIGQRDSARL